MFAIDLVKYLSDLSLSQSLCVKATGKLLALFILVAKNRQYLGMEIAETVTRNLEFEFSAMAISVA